MKKVELLPRMLLSQIVEGAKTYDELFKELVSKEGKCDTVAGELLRAYSRIAYRFFNDGDKVYAGYGNETVNPSYRYLRFTLYRFLHNDERFITKYALIFYHLDSGLDDKNYKIALKNLENFIVDVINISPLLKELSNTEDSLSRFENCCIDTERFADDDEDDDETDYDYERWCDYRSLVNEDDEEDEGRELEPDIDYYSYQGVLNLLEYYRQQIAELSNELQQYKKNSK